MARMRNIGSGILWSGLVYLVAGAHFSVIAENNEEKKDLPQGMFLEELEYEQRVYSKEQKAELQDRTELDIKLRYQFNPSTYIRFRLDMDPVDDSRDDKSSKLEVSGQHKYEDLTFALDLDLKTSDGESGGTSLGPDADSEHTYISYQPVDSFRVTLYPYNFDGEVGDEFNTWDVTRIYFIDGAPDAVTADQQSEEKIEEKTIPGIQIDIMPFDGFTVYAAFGAASYQYPARDRFDLEADPSAGRWEVKEDKGVKYGILFENDMIEFAAKHVSHDQSEETGSLLESATEVTFNLYAAGMFLNTEYVHTKAGKKPYRLDRERGWFEDINPYLPYYSSRYTEELHDWLGKADSAWMIKAGAEFNKFEPYLAYKSLGEYFIFREPESAHRLRTSDQQKSHGGLNIIALGSNFDYGKYEIIPELEFMTAKNEVFGKTADVRSSDVLEDKRKTNYLLTLNVNYRFDDDR